jgi:hypothetical protein
MDFWERVHLRAAWKLKFRSWKQRRGSRPDQRWAAGSAPRAGAGRWRRRGRTRGTVAAAVGSARRLRGEENRGHDKCRRRRRLPPWGPSSRIAWWRSAARLAMLDSAHVTSPLRGFESCADSALLLTAARRAGRGRGGGVADDPVTRSL